MKCCPKCGEQNALDPSVVNADKVTRSYWTCRACKTRFRDADDLEKELKTANPKMAAYGHLISALGGVFLLIFGLFINGKYQQMGYWAQQANSGMRMAALALGLAGIVEMWVFLMLFIKKMQVWNQLQQEKAELNQ